jgi:hypothetical protein
MDRYVRDRLLQLQGGKTVQKQRPEAARDKDRRLVHEIRDVYKTHMRKAAAEQLSGRKITKRQAEVLGGPGWRQASRYGQPGVKSKRWKFAHYFPEAVGKRPWERDDMSPASPLRKAARRGASPRPSRKGRKRRAPDLQDEDEWLSAKRSRHFEPLPQTGVKRKRRPDGRTPSAKRLRWEEEEAALAAALRHGAAALPPGGRRGRKRKKAMGDDDDGGELEEEELTGIPFKSRAVTYR